MEDIKNVRKRIKHRRYGGMEEVEKKHSSIVFKVMYRLMMLVMGVCVMVLVLLLNQRLNLVQMPAVLQNFKIEDISKWLPFENWFSLKDEAVSATPSYSLLKENHYANGSNVAYNAYDGVILHVQSKNSKTSLTIKQDNGVITTYGNLSEVSLKQDERILKGRPLGTYAQYVTIDFLKDNKTIDLNAALQNNH
ncbi:M23 family peptidase [Amedibacillus sp. YH-ame6]